MSGMMAFVSCANENAIVSLHLDEETGALREVARTIVPGTEQISPTSLPMALSHDRRTLHAALRSPPYPVTSFAINAATGELSRLGGDVLPEAMAYLATDRTDRFLLSASYGGGLLAVNEIGPHRAVGKTIQVLKTPPKAHSILPDPANRFVYAASLGGDVVLCQAFDAATGRLSEPAHAAVHSKPGAGPRHIAFARDGALLYLVNELDGSVNTYARDAATGALTELQSITLLPPGAGPKASAADLHLTPDERFLYASERSTDTLAMFAVDPADGMLTALGHVASEPTPRGFRIDPSGRYLLCAGLASGTVGVYAVGADGMLEKRGTTPVGGGANWVEIIPQ
jgi:6-phosphogluconolactonase